MTARSLLDLIGTDNDGIIQERLPDNNAGEISAADVRSSIVDTIESITKIVSESDFTTTPFLFNAKLQHNSSTGAGGLLQVSGIKFDNNASVQTEPFPGVGSISHDSLGGRTGNDPHPGVFVRLNGFDQMNGNLGLKNNWVNSSGSAYTSNGCGLQFVRINPLSDQEYVNVGSGTTLNFLNDGSTMSSAKGVAKAWIHFDATTNPLTVRDSYNISGIQRTDAGQFIVTFNSGVFKNNYYVAFGNSNAQSLVNEGSQFTNNTVGLVKRSGDDGTSLRTLTLYVKDEGGNYCNAKINELVVFGTNPSGVVKTNITITEPS